MPAAAKARLTVYLPPKLARQARRSAKQSGQSLSGWYALATVAMLANQAHGQRGNAADYERLMAPAKAKFLADMAKIDKERGA